MELMRIARPYFEGLSRRELLLPWCASCGKPHFYPRSACPHCWAEEYTWRTASGRASVHSVTQVRANPPSKFKALLPYWIAIVELEEQVRMLTNLVDDGRAFSVGDPLHLQFADRDGESLPMFRRAADAESFPKFRRAT